jgi:SNF2 family DNA or RNA helicase
MILDNRDNGRVLDALKDSIQKGDKLNIITRQLSLFGYSALKDELNKIDSAKLLFSLREMFPENGQELPPVMGSREDRGQRNELTVQAIAKQFDDWLKQKVHLKVSEDSLNANHYEILGGNGSHAVISGSSTLTSSGLGVIPSPSHEMNTLFKDDENVERLHKWFDNIWSSAEGNEEARERLFDQLQKIYKPRSPQKLYFQTLYHLFKDSLDLIDEEKVMKTRTGIKNTEIWKKLYKFQEDGVISAISKIEQHNGCIIADSVGLGKTYEALAIIKYYELRNDRVLVLVPKKLRDNWTIYTLNDKRNLFAEDRFNYDVLNHTDLTRDGGFSGDINLETVNWGTYDLIVIDESHNFRNNPPKKD